MTAKNHFQINRRLFDHPLWLEEPFTKGQAWVDLIGNANYKDGYFIKKGQRVNVLRGQTGTSMLTFAKRWQWSRGKVKRFFVFLEKEQMVIQLTGHLTTLITICNYDVYQLENDDGDTSGKTSNGHLTDIERTSDGTHPRRIKKNKEELKQENSFPESSDEFQLAAFLLEHIRRHKSDFKQPNLQAWAKSADMILRVDKRTLANARAVIAWCQADEFWQSNILSMSKLRKQFDALGIKMNGKNGGSKQKTPAGDDGYWRELENDEKRSAEEYGN